MTNGKYFITADHIPLMRYVLDTSALLSGRDFLIEHEWYTSPKVVDEIKHGRMHRKLNYLLEVSLKVLMPKNESIQLIKKGAERTGDIGRLSSADIEILALAKEMNATLLTDDYSIQNLAEELNIDYKGIDMEEIKKKIYWRYRCKGCGKYWEELHKTCPICGSRLRTVR